MELAPGARAKVYGNPWADENSEGEGVLVTFISDMQTDGELWEVKIDGQEETVNRAFHKRHVTVEAPKFDPEGNPETPAEAEPTPSEDDEDDLGQV